jgi:hypothetical protein
MPSRLDEPRSLRHPSNPSSSSSKQKMYPRLDELRTSRHPSNPPSSSSRQKMPSRLDASNKPKAELDTWKNPTPSPETPYLRTEYDRTMASRQTRIASLPPKEREKQEAWAESHLGTLPGLCPVGFKWKRVDELNGYQCEAGNHLITDELIREGRGRYKANISKHLGGTVPWYMLEWSDPIDPPLEPPEPMEPLEDLIIPKVVSSW